MNPPRLGRRSAAVVFSALLSPFVFCTMLSAVAVSVVAEPPKTSGLQAVPTAGGTNFYDANGKLVFVKNANNVTIYSRDLQQQQRQMNQDPQAQVPLVPETGGYNKETFEYAYWSLRNQYDALRVSLLREQAERSGHPQEFTLRENSLLRAGIAVEEYKTAMKKVSTSMEDTWAVTDSDLNGLAQHQQKARLELNKSVLDKHLAYLKRIEDRLNPSAPDYYLPPNLKESPAQFLARVQRLRQFIRRTRDLLDQADSTSVDPTSIQSDLTAIQSELSILDAAYQAK